VNVILYVKDECSLCEDAEQMLRHLQKRLRFSLEIVDVENDPEAYRRYRDKVPVLLIDGEEVPAAPVDEDRLLAALSF
jgi:glutaredoxin